MIGTYEDLAAEYYDPIRHPTCANFREASAHILKTWLKQWSLNDGWLCEVGPGNSIVGELLVEKKMPLNGLILVDSSPSMLAYSRPWVNSNAHSLIGDACLMPLCSKSIYSLVSSLGDPYNLPRFWEETSRVLRPGGVSIFTTPSFEWASAFRGGEKDQKMRLAEFQLSNGLTLCVPSYIYAVDEQKKLIEEHGLLVKEVLNVSISFLRVDTLSPKLFPAHGPHVNVVTGYLLVKV